MSTSTSGAASRSFIIGIRLCPPATSRASGPYRRNKSTASSTEVATSYSNRAGTCKAPPPFPKKRAPSITNRTFLYGCANRAGRAVFGRRVRYFRCSGAAFGGGCVRSRTHIRNHQSRASKQLRFLLRVGGGGDLPIEADRAYRSDRLR